MNRKLQVDPTNSFRCDVKEGRKHCNGTCLIPVNMKQRAEIRGDEPLTVSQVEFNCGHKRTVIIER